MPFGEGITELRMRENRDFVVPVDILTTFARAPFSLAARHTTVCLDNTVHMQLPYLNRLCRLTIHDSLISTDIPFYHVPELYCLGCWER